MKRFFQILFAHEQLGTSIAAGFSCAAPLRSTTWSGNSGHREVPLVFSPSRHSAHPASLDPFGRVSQTLAFRPFLRRLTVYRTPPNPFTKGFVASPNAPRWNNRTDFSCPKIRSLVPRHEFSRVTVSSPISPTVFFFFYAKAACAATEWF